jgi:photosystem II stability/assembly factor-like uncharacterized protein
VCAATDANTFISENAGATWSQSSGNNMGNYDLNAICAFDEHNLIVCGNDGTVFKSNNNGNSWTLTETQSMTSINSALSLNSTTAISCGLSGSILKQPIKEITGQVYLTDKQSISTT